MQCVSSVWDFQYAWRLDWQVVSWLHCTRSRGCGAAITVDEHLQGSFG